MEAAEGIKNNYFWLPLLDDELSLSPFGGLAETLSYFPSRTQRKPPTAA